MLTHDAGTLVSSILLVSMTTLAVVLAGSRVLRRNRRLFWCLCAALALHGAALTGLWRIGGGTTVAEATPQRPTITIEPLQPATPPPPPPKLVIPTGTPDGDPATKRPPRGDSHRGKPGTPASGGTKVLTDHGKKTTPFVLPEGPDLPGDGLSFTQDFSRFKDGTGTGGDNYGTKDGVKNGNKPRGIGVGMNDGGRVYFVRYKFGTGAWNAYAEGTERLLGFANRYVPCESASRAMGADDVRAQLERGEAPAFLYLYCDETFTLSASDVRVLQAYLQEGGFLFLDSRPDPEVRARVTGELARVLPGAPLRALPASHPVHRFYFRIAPVAVGENIIDRQNYGITRGGTLAAFYSMGNLAHLFAGHAPDDMTYVTAQYQQGVNVIFYALRHGDAGDLTTRRGANATITSDTLHDVFTTRERLGAAGTSVKVPRTKAPVYGAPPPPGVPDDINVLP
jgi:hypothetical protein